MLVAMFKSVLLILFLYACLCVVPSQLFIKQQHLIAGRL